VNQPIRVRLSGSAQQFITMLRDFGHLDEPGIEQLLMVLAEAYGEVDEVEVDLDDVRRVAADMLFERAPDELAMGEGILAEDWAILFS
jgi:hypothetical protein